MCRLDVRTSKNSDRFRQYCASENLSFFLSTNVCAVASYDIISLDVAPLSYERISQGRPLREENII